MMMIVSSTASKDAHIAHKAGWLVFACAIAVQARPLLGFGD